jgi:hypothetical protein
MIAVKRVTTLVLEAGCFYGINCTALPFEGHRRCDLDVGSQMKHSYILLIQCFKKRYCNCTRNIITMQGGNKNTVAV